MPHLLAFRVTTGCLQGAMSGNPGFDSHGISSKYPPPFACLSFLPLHPAPGGHSQPEQQIGGRCGLPRVRCRPPAGQFPEEALKVGISSSAVMRGFSEWETGMVHKCPQRHSPVCIPTPHPYSLTMQFMPTIQKKIVHPGPRKSIQVILMQYLRSQRRAGQNRVWFAFSGRDRPSTSRLSAYFGVCRCTHPQMPGGHNDLGLWSVRTTTQGGWSG